MKTTPIRAVLMQVDGGCACGCVPVTDAIVAEAKAELATLEGEWNAAIEAAAQKALAMSEHVHAMSQRGLLTRLADGIRALKREAK